MGSIYFWKWLLRTHLHTKGLAQFLEPWKCSVYVIIITILLLLAKDLSLLFAYIRLEHKGAYP